MAEEFSVHDIDGRSTMNGPAYMEQQQMQQKRQEAGRYTLEEAALILHKDAGERQEAMLKDLMLAVRNKDIPVYEPQKNATYEPLKIRGWYEEIYWNDLNIWLAKKHPRVTWRFPGPQLEEKQFECGFAEATISNKAELPLIATWSNKALTAFQPEIQGEPHLPATAAPDDVSSLTQKGNSPTSTQEAEGTGLTKWERQIRAIVSAIATLGYEALKVPNGGKKKLMAECKRTAPELFGAGNDPFLDAWKEALKQNRVRMKEHHKYANK